MSNWGQIKIIIIQKNYHKRWPASPVSPSPVTRTISSSATTTGKRSSPARLTTRCCLGCCTKMHTQIRCGGAWVRFDDQPFPSAGYTRDRLGGVRCAGVTGALGSQGALGSGLEIKQGSNFPLRRAASTTHSAAKNLGSLPPSQLSPNGGNG